MPTGNNVSKDVSFKGFCCRMAVFYFLHCITVTDCYKFGRVGMYTYSKNCTIQSSSLDQKCVLLFIFLFSSFRTNAGLSLRPRDPTFTLKNNPLKSFSSFNVQRQIPLEVRSGAGASAILTGDGAVADVRTIL